MESRLISKAWVENWEKHIDLLEDEFTGPLYKTIAMDKTFSVSKINEIVSCWFIFLWISLIVNFLYEEDLLVLFGKVQPGIFICSFVTLIFIVSMFRGYGRGRFAYKEFKMYER